MRARQRDASHLSRFRATGDAELLGAESEQMLRGMGSTPFHLLKVNPSPGSSLSLLNSVPVVNLIFSQLAPRQFMVDAGSPLKLNAFAILAKHSQRLDGFLELKRAFWTDVLSSRAIKAARGVYACSFSSPEFSRFNIHFRHYQHLCEVNEALIEVVYTLITTLTAMQTQQQQSELKDFEQSIAKSNQMVAFGLSFVRCNPTATSLERIERLLDRAFVHPDRQYDIRILDFSSKAMDDAALAAVARIVQKKNVYQIEEVKLNEIILATFTGTRTRALFAILISNTILRELRLHSAAFGARELLSLREVLQGNRTLEQLELIERAEHLTDLDPDDVTLERSCLDAAYQGQVLQSSLPMETKLAFLSAMTTNQRGEALMRSLLDSWLLSLIIAFAASYGVKRKIAWNADFVSH